MWFPNSWSEKDFHEGGINELRFNSAFQRVLKLSSLTQNCFPGNCAAFSFGVVMLSGMISNGFTKVSGNVATFQVFSLCLFSHYSQKHDCNMLYIR